MCLCIFPQGQEGFCFVGLNLSQDIHQEQVRSVKHIPHYVLNSTIVGFTSPPPIGLIFREFYNPHSLSDCENTFHCLFDLLVEHLSEHTLQDIHADGIPCKFPLLPQSNLPILDLCDLIVSCSLCQAEIFIKARFGNDLPPSTSMSPILATKD